MYSSVPAHFLVSALPLSVRLVHQSVDEVGSTIHVVLYAKHRATSVCSPDSMQTACIRTTCSIATYLNGDLAQPQSLLPNAVRPSHDGVSNTVLLCGQMRILTAVERNLTLRSGTCVWMISSL